jgi:hypothetical protein
MSWQIILASWSAAEVATWVSIVTSPLTLLALLLAWLQLKRTADATEATQTAVERTGKNMAIYQLLILIPQLQQYEGDLDRAVTSDDHAAAVDVLNDWRKAGTEATGLLGSRPHVEDIVNHLQESFVQAFQAKRSLLERRGTVHATTEDVRESIGKVTVHLGTLSGQLKANIGGDVT